MNNTELVFDQFDYGFQDKLSNLNIRYMNEISYGKILMGLFK